MKSLMKMGIWYSNLAKRLFRKKTFLGILVLVPLLVAALSFTTDSEAGVLKIAIVQEAKKDQAAEQLCERLLNQDSVILYIETESREEAMLFLQEKKVDAVYILKEDFSNHLEQYFKATLFRPSLIEILQREENVSLRLAREKLFGELYDSFSRELYVQFIQENFEKPQISPVLTCKELLFYYEKSKRQDSLFVLSFPGGEEVQLQSNSYLLSPIRGLLSLVLILSALAAELYYLEDEQKGCFVWVSEKNRYLLSYVYLFSAMVPVAIMILFALCFSGSFTSFFTEIGMLLLLLLMIAFLANILRKACGNVTVLAVCIPVLILLMLSCSQIFIELAIPKKIQYLLPSYYYVNAVNNKLFLPKMGWYCVIALALDLVTEWVISKKRK